MKKEAMKIEKTNNPVAVGALVLVLTLITGRILWMLLGHGGSVSAASPLVAATLPTTADAAGKGISAPILSAGQKTSRNPFSFSGSFSGVAPQERAPTIASPKPARSHIRAATLVVKALAPLPTQPISPDEISHEESHAAASRVQAAPAPAPKSALLKTGPKIAPQAIAARDPGHETLQSIKLMAIIGGAQPAAVLQTTRPEPITAHVGDDVEGLRLAAIGDHQIVFAHGRNLWTLPLSSDGEAAPAAVSAVTATASQETMNATR